MDRLGAFAPATSEVVETQSSFVTAMGSAFELHRAVSAVVGASVRSGKLPVLGELQQRNRHGGRLAAHEFRRAPRCDLV